MKRKKQCLCYLFLIVALSFLYIQMNRLYFSPEAVFYACERGLRSGPSEEILLQCDIADGGVMLVGRQKEGLFVVPAEKDHIFFWRMKGGTVDGAFPVEDGAVKGYIMREGTFVGLSRCPEVTEISFVAEDIETDIFRKFDCVVGENGFLMCETEMNGWDSTVVYLEGRNAAGEIFFTYGDEKYLEKTERKGV